MLSRLLGLAATGSLLAATAAGPAGAVTGSIWQVVPSANPQSGQVTNSSFSGVSMGSTNDG